MLRAKNYLNRPMFHGVIQKITLAQFFWDTVYMYQHRAGVSQDITRLLNNVADVEVQIEFAESAHRPM